MEAEGKDSSPPSFPQWILFLSLQALRKETTWRGQVFSTHPLSQELGQALIGGPRRDRADSCLANPRVSWILQVCNGTCNTKVKGAVGWFTIQCGTHCFGEFLLLEAYALVGKWDSQVLSK